MPGAAEGVAPPDAKPVTVHEALEVLGTQVCMYVQLQQHVFKLGLGGINNTFFGIP